MGHLVCTAVIGVFPVHGFSDWKKTGLTDSVPVFGIYICCYKCLLQFVEKAERAFNASSTLTPDSIMSDESQSRDWQLSEQVPACSAATGPVTDVPPFAMGKTFEPSVLQFSSPSAEAVESSVHDNSDKCEYSDATESPQQHNRCMLSGIDISSVNSDPNISVRSEDVSMCAELNDARLSASDGDSSANSTLKGSDADELSCKYSGAEIDALQPTLAVSIPISTVFEEETKNDEKNANVHSTDVKLFSGSEPVREAYSPISEASDKATNCWTPIRQPTEPPIINQCTTREFSPISPFTPSPSAPGTPVPVVPLCWDVSSSAGCDAGKWSISANTGTTQQHHSDVIMSATAAAPELSALLSDSFTSGNNSSYSCQSRLGYGNVVRPTEVSVRVGPCQNVSFEQQQHSAVFQHRVCQQLENRHPGPVLPRHRYTSLPDQPFMYSSNAVGGSISMNLYSANIQSQESAQRCSAEARKYNVGLPTTAVWGSKNESNRFAISSYAGMRSAQEVSSVRHLSPVTSHAHVDSCDNSDRLQVRQSLKPNTSFSGSTDSGQLFTVLISVSYR